MAIYKQNGSNCWSYDFTVDGKRFRGSTKQINKTAALSIEAELRVRAREKGLNFIPRRRSMTLRELAPRFLEWIGGAQLEPKTQIYYDAGWKLLTRTSLPQMQLTHVTGDLVDATRFLKADGKECSPKYANQAICTLKRMLSKAREWHLIAEVPELKPRKSYGRFRVISYTEEAQLLHHAAQPLRDILIVALDTGMRPSEIFAMRWENVFWDTQEYFIAKSKTDAGRRRVPLSTRMREALFARWSGQNDGYVFATGSKVGHITSVKTAFRTARTKAKLDERIVLYSARHTFGTFATAATKNLPMVMQTMGHANIRSTLPYQHHGFDGIRAVIEERNAEVKSAS